MHGTTIKIEIHIKQTIFSLFLTVPRSNFKGPDVSMK